MKLDSKQGRCINVKKNSKAIIVTDKTHEKMLRILSEVFVCCHPEDRDYIRWVIEKLYKTH